MKQISALFLAVLVVLMMSALIGCGSKQEDPGPPPSDVIDPQGASEGASGGTSEESGGSPYEGDILENAVSVRIGRNGQTDWSVDMYNNAASVTMLDYLSGSSLLFPIYTYEEEEGFVAQNVRGSYSRDDEVTVADVKTGELYLMSGGQLRFYFKDVEGVNITATPVGYYTETEGLTEAVQEAYQSNLGDTWGVDVYFQIKKTIG